MYCTGTDRNKTRIGMPSTTATDGLSLSNSVMDVVEILGLEANIVGITSDGGGNIRLCREALESKYSNDSSFNHPSPSSPWSSLRIYWHIDLNVGVKLINSDDGEVDIKLTRSNIHK